MLGCANSTKLFISFNLQMREKRQMGIALLHRALHVYLAEGESQMKPDDF